MCFARNAAANAISCAHTSTHESLGPLEMVIAEDGRRGWVGSVDGVSDGSANLALPPESNARRKRGRSQQAWAGAVSYRTLWEAQITPPKLILPSSLTGALPVGRRIWPLARVMYVGISQDCPHWFSCLCRTRIDFGHAFNPLGAGNLASSQKQNPIERGTASR